MAVATTERPLTETFPLGCEVTNQAVSNLPMKVIWHSPNGRILCQYQQQRGGEIEEASFRPEQLRLTGQTGAGGRTG